MKRNLLFFAIAILTIGFYSCKNVANYPIDKPSADIKEDRLWGKWKFVEDTNKNNFYQVIDYSKHCPECRYHVQFWDRGGKNRTYEANVHFSMIGDNIFINVPYWEGEFQNKGYFFLRVLEMNNDFTKFTTATVQYPNMRDLKSSEEVRALIAKNLNNPKFYYDTVHFYKVQ
jgi:hypothetical protein